MAKSEITPEEYGGLFLISLVLILTENFVYAIGVMLLYFFVMVIIEKIAKKKFKY